MTDGDSLAIGLSPSRPVPASSWGGAAMRRPRVAPSRKKCVECGTEFVGRKDRLLCGARRCKDRRYARLHPEELRAKERRKYQRRRIKASPD